MTDKAPIAGGYIIAAAILVASLLIVGGIFIGREIFRCHDPNPVDRSAWVSDSLHLSTILQDKDRQIRELDSIVTNRTPTYIRIDNAKRNLALQPDSDLMRHFLADPGAEH